WELAEAEDTSILEEAFSRVLEAEDEPEASDCMIAIAAAEVVAALRKRPSVKPPDEVVEYVTRIGAAPSPELVQSALEATKRIQKKSELQELWDESEGRAEWDKS